MISTSVASSELYEPSVPKIGATQRVARGNYATEKVAQGVCGTRRNLSRVKCCRLRKSARSHKLINAHIRDLSDEMEKQERTARIGELLTTYGNRKSSTIVANIRSLRSCNFTLAADVFRFLR